MYLRQGVPSGKGAVQLKGTNFEKFSFVTIAAAVSTSGLHDLGRKGMGYASVQWIEMTEKFTALLSSYGALSIFHRLQWPWRQDGRLSGGNTRFGPGRVGFANISGVWNWTDERKHTRNQSQSKEYRWCLPYLRHTNRRTRDLEVKHMVLTLSWSFWQTIWGTLNSKNHHHCIENYQSNHVFRWRSTYPAVMRWRGSSFLM